MKSKIAILAEAAAEDRTGVLSAYLHDIMAAIRGPDAASARVRGCKEKYTIPIRYWVENFLGWLPKQWRPGTVEGWEVLIREANEEPRETEWPLVFEEDHYMNHVKRGLRAVVEVEKWLQRRAQEEL